MKKRVWSIAVACVCVLSGFTLAEVRRDTPATLSGPRSSEPFWVSLRALTDSSKRQDYEIDRGTQEAIRPGAQYLRDPEREAEFDTGPCQVAVTRAVHIDASSSTWEDLLTHSEVIIRGRVAAIEPGFSLGMPLSLLQVQVTKYLRKAPSLPLEEKVYVFYPQVDFRLNGMRFCNTAPFGDVVPQVGDEVAVFAYDPPQLSTNFVSTSPEHLIFIRDGELLTQRNLWTDANFKSLSTPARLERAINSAPVRVPHESRERRQ